jgi:hypothetical protein
MVWNLVKYRENFTFTFHFITVLKFPSGGIAEEAVEDFDYCSSYYIY